MARRRLAIYAMGIALVAVLVGYLALPRSEQHPAEAATPARIGGAFSMVSQDGVEVSEKTYAGKVWLMFVGFTHCPDICPTTLAEMSSWFEALGAEADAVQGFLVTVDPERDTVDVLKRYVSSFDRRIVALRPEPEQLPQFAKNYRITYARVPIGDGDYTMDHTAGVLLFDRTGRFSGTIDLHEPQEIALQKIRRLIARQDQAM